MRISDWSSDVCSSDLRDSLTSALRAALADVGIDAPAEIHLERPARREHGDWSSNLAMATAKKNGRNPRELAGEPVDRLTAAPPAPVDRAAHAGPGFVNLPLTAHWPHATLTDSGADRAGGFREE